MNTYTFTYNGIKYSGHIISSNTSEQYFWFTFNDDEMISRFGDSIAFRLIRGKLVPVYTYTKNAMFIEDIRRLVEAELKSQQVFR